jgi:hypothetical protein
MNEGPAKRMVKMTMDWKIACPRICFTIFLEMIYSYFLYGGLCNNSGFGVSVARAKEARESIIRLTQRSWIAARGLFCIAREPMRQEKRATTLTDS